MNSTVECKVPMMGMPKVPYLTAIISENKAVIEKQTITRQSVHETLSVCEISACSGVLLVKK